MEFTNSPLVSIIIVNYNGLEYLQKCLDSILNNDFKNYEIILVDNNSQDESKSFVKEHYPSVSIIELVDNFGFAKPNNLGAKKAKGDLFYFLNNDTMISKNSIVELLKIMNKEEIAICQSLLLHPDGSIDSAGDYVNNFGIPFSSTDNSSEIKNILSARGAAMMIKKNIFWELSGFDEKFFASFEDVDIGWRSWLYGHAVILVPKSVVYHVGGSTVRKLSLEIKFHGVKNFLMLYLVNFEQPIFPSFIKLGKIIFGKQHFKKSYIGNEVNFELPSFSIAFRSLLWVLKNLRYILKKRKIVNSKRVRTTKDLINLGLIKQC